MQFLLQHQTKLKTFVEVFYPLIQLILQNCNYLHLYRMIEMNLMNVHEMVLCYFSMKPLIVHLNFDLDMMLKLLVLKMKIEAMVYYLFEVFQMLLDFQLNGKKLNELLEFIIFLASPFTLILTSTSFIWFASTVFSVNFS